MTGSLEPNRAPAGAETVVTCDGPEDVAFDAEGRLYAGTGDHSVVRTVDADTTDAALEPFARLDGRPLGMAFDGEAVESLHDPDGRVFGVTSATPHDGAPYLGSLFGERAVRPRVSAGAGGSSFTPLSQSYRAAPA